MPSCSILHVSVFMQMAGVLHASDCSRVYYDYQTMGEIPDKEGSKYMHFLILSVHTPKFFCNTLFF